MLTPFHSAASLIKAAACRRGFPVSSEMVNKAEMFCPHPEALKGREEGDEDYYSVKKNKGLYIQAPVRGSSSELSSCSFLMCFSLPESNSFPGPRQLHINWPRRQCQGYSAQVLWRCHHQLNIDLEVCSSPALSLILSPIFFFLSFVFEYVIFFFFCISPALYTDISFSSSSSLILSPHSCFLFLLSVCFFGLSTIHSRLADIMEQQVSRTSLRPVPDGHSLMPGSAGHPDFSLPLYSIFLLPPF